MDNRNEREIRKQSTAIVMQRLQTYIDRAIISVSEVTQILGVSRALWYMWKSGHSVPSEELLNLLKSLLAFLVSMEGHLQKVKVHGLDIQDGRFVLKEGDK